MAGRCTIPYGSTVVLDRDGDYTYFVHADNEAGVLQLAAGISSRGVLAAIARPFRIKRMAKLIGMEINMVNDTEIRYVENARPLTMRELAEDLIHINPIDINSLRG